MTGLVIASHSQQAAEGIREIALEMGGDATVVAVGGDPEGGIGSTAPAIEEALRSVDEDSVVVIADLGSAVMNAEIAVEQVEDEIEAVIADAPILEGALNAAVAAASGADVAAVRERAEEAREHRKLS